jgi:hypothetical protein
MVPARRSQFVSERPRGGQRIGGLAAAGGNHVILEVLDLDTPGVVGER